MRTHWPHWPQRPHGLSLVEVCIGLALVALVACLAWPSWSQASLKTRRAEAISALLALQQAQEQRYAATGAYTDDLAALGWPNGLTASGLYRLAVSGASVAGYLASATAVLGAPQADTECAVLAVRWSWGQSSWGSACAGCAGPADGAGLNSSASVPTPLLDPGRCWSR